MVDVFLKGEIKGVAEGDLFDFEVGFVKVDVGGGSVDGGVGV